MAENLTQRLQAFKDAHQQRALYKLLKGLYEPLSSQSLTSAGLVISAGGAATAKTGATVWTGIAGGVLQQIAAATAMPALAGTVLQNNFGIYAWVVNAAGTVSQLPLAQAATLAAVSFPLIPEDSALIGFVTLNPTTAAFIGATTLLDAASTNAVYANPVGAFDATANYNT